MNSSRGIRGRIEFYDFAEVSRSFFYEPYGSLRGRDGISAPAVIAILYLIHCLGGHKSLHPVQAPLESRHRHPRNCCCCRYWFCCLGATSHVQG